jgi:hypothetical protein
VQPVETQPTRLRKISSPYWGFKSKRSREAALQAVREAHYVPEDRQFITITVTASYSI